MNHKIHFRQVDEPYASMGVFWHIEYYKDSPLFPVGLAVVVAVGTGAQLNIIFVVDQWRNKGIGKQLVAACLEKWPKLLPTSSISIAGAKLLKMFPSYVSELTVDD